MNQLCGKHIPTSEFGNSPQTIINEQINIDEIDMVIAIFGTKIGTPTTKHQSGTIEELTKFVDKKKPAMILFSTKSMEITDNMSKAMSQKIIDEKDKVKEFKKECQGKSLYFTFDNISDFERKIKHQLDLKFVNMKNYGGSGLNYTLRLTSTGINAVPIVPIGNDNSGKEIIKKIKTVRERTNLSPLNLNNLLQSKLKTIDSLILSDRRGRTIWSKDNCTLTYTLFNKYKICRNQSS